MKTYDHADTWRGERLMPTVTFTGTPLIPYVIAEPTGPDWDREFARAMHEAERRGWPRAQTHRFAGVRHAIGMAIIWTGERIAGMKPGQPAAGAASDLHVAH